MANAAICENQNLKIVVGKMRRYFIAVINSSKGLGSIKSLFKKNINFVLFNEYCNLLKSFDFTEEEMNYLTYEIEELLNFVKDPYMRSRLNEIITDLNL